ncbi:hypothetical protein DID88_010007 [Monilinia fructigena]|uniref:Uncharacterized protein n=1 Tax=Monilinia fructigena TaxID=38457 RepID=A0A395IQQ5_9HELO|nr:hypothetical protein DID88_010007 [Monilinia fructigena]
MSDHTYELTLMNTNEAGSCSFNLRWEPGTDEECLITMDDRNFRVSFENTVLGNYKLIVSWDAIKKDTSAPQMAQPRLMIEEEEEPSESIRWPYGGPYNLDSLFRASQKAQMRER